MKFITRLMFVAVALFVAQGLFARDEHPGYFNALGDLRAARWLIDHVPGDWVRVADEQNAVQAIDAAMNEIKIAEIWDGKGLEEHPPVDERADHKGRLHAALDFLQRARADVARDRDEGIFKGLRDRAWGHIDRAIGFTQAAIRSVGMGPGAMAPAPGPAGAMVPAGGDHPAYLHSLSDLRAARWLLSHTPGDWARIREEAHAIEQIDAAINELRKASIDDGKDLNWHPAVQERGDHGGRLHDTLDILKAARNDLNAEEDNGWAKGLRNRAWGHIDIALRDVEKALRDNGWW